MARTNIIPRTTSSTGATGIQMSREQMNESIRKKAFELYEKRGRRPGHAMDDWLEAERIVRQRAI